MEKQYTNFNKEIFTSIDDVYSETETLLSIIGGYLHKYRIFNEVERQNIIGSIIIDIEKYVTSKPISSGYIHRIIKNTILQFLRPVVKKIDHQYQEDDSFASTLPNEENVKEEYFQRLEEIINICPDSHKEYIDSILEGKTKTELGATKYNKLRLYREDIKKVASMYEYMEIMAKNEDLIVNFAKEHNISKTVLTSFVNKYKSQKFNI